MRMMVASLYGRQVKVAVGWHVEWDEKGQIYGVLKEKVDYSIFSRYH